MPKVLNARHISKRQPNQVYVGRYYPGWGSSKWGNPFKPGRDGTLDECIEKYRAYVLQKPKLMAALPEIRGMDLVCSCAPDRCHGDVLLELANA
jgi:hypothetical protein